MELGWWTQLGLTFLQLLLISSLPRGTVSSRQDTPVGRHLLSGVCREWAWGPPIVGAAGGLWGLRWCAWLLPENVTWFCHPNLWD